MRPIVQDEWRQFDAQTHAYAEYRVFSALAAERLRSVHATVALSAVHGDEKAGARRVLCTITVSTGEGERLEAVSAEDHPYAAIDRAVERLLRACRKRGTRGVRAGAGSPRAVSS